jgi:RHS repeat-associated protein
MYDAVRCGYDGSVQLFTGKERDYESGNDYFGARYYASSMGRFMSPDSASNPTAVPYASYANPQSLNLYGYVGNNPLSRADADGHCFPFCDLIAVATNYIVSHPTATARANAVINKVGAGVQKFQSVAAAHPRTMQALKGGAKMVGGVATVAVSATAEVGSGGLATVPIMFGVMGGSAMFVGGFTDIMGATTNTNVSEADKALSAVSNPAGLLTTVATGDIEKGSQAAAIGDALVTLGTAGDIVEGSRAAVGIKTALAGQSLSEGAQAVNEATHPAPEKKPEN